MSLSKFFFTLLCLSFISGLNAQNIIDGNVSMWGTTDYSGVKVIAHRFAPTTYMDSTYSDVSGNYSIDVPDGIYHFYFIKDGYENDTIADQAIYANATLANVFMEIIGIFGPISGVLHAGNYKVSDDLIVPEGDTLLIEPGVNLLFKYDVKFEIYGYLIANGTAEDSIIFTRYNGVEAWNGIKFYDQCNDNSCISYARVSFSHAHGIAISYSNVSITHSVICNNSMINGQFGAMYGGGGIYASYANPELDSLIIRNNYASCSGGGIIFRYYSGDQLPRRITNSVFINNSTKNEGGAIWFDGNILEIENTQILGNTDSLGYCGGAFVYGYDLKLNNVIFAQNSNPQSDGGSLYFINNDSEVQPKLKMKNVTIDGGNSYNGLALMYSDIAPPSIEMTNCIVFGNKYFGISYWNNLPPGIDPVISHSLFYNNLQGNINYDMPWFGDIVTTNPNGTDCDAWSNIFVDPVFVDSLNGDYQLAPESPCIDAGNNDSVDFWYDLLYNYRIWDGNGDMVDVVDMGAYEFNSIFNGSEKPVIKEIPELSLYPNPTDGLVSIPGKPVKEIEVYSVSGRKMCSVYNVNSVDLSDFPSGVYYLKIKYDNTVVSRKAVKL